MAFPSLPIPLSHSCIGRWSQLQRQKKDVVVEAITASSRTTTFLRICARHHLRSVVSAQDVTRMVLPYSFLYKFVFQAKKQEIFPAGFRIRIDLMRIRIQHFF
jgi:hypothetical protein